MSCIFFYGLFMDSRLLQEKGFDPKIIGPAELPGYQIRIGNRATLIPSRHSVAYGMLIDLAEKDAIALYSAPDVRDYRPESVKTILLSDRSIRPSLCYNLPVEELGAGINHEYAERLSALVLELGFAPAYADEVERRGRAEEDG